MRPVRSVLLAALLGLLSHQAEAHEVNDAVFQDCRECPEMVVIPAGDFLMGSPANEGERMDREGGAPGSLSFLVDEEWPQRAISIRRFAASRYEITVAEFEAFVRETNYPEGRDCISDQDGNLLWEFSGPGSWRTPGFDQSDNDPVVCVSWHDAQSYVAWLNGKTGGGYRLLTEAEWEYAARGGSTTPYVWGQNFDDACVHANVADATAQARYRDWPLHSGFEFTCTDGVIQTTSVGRFQPNAFGLYDMVGNVSEWVQDCSSQNLRSVSPQGGAFEIADCDYRVTRGGGWSTVNPQMSRSAYRGGWRSVERWDALGFRVAKAIAN